LKKPKPMSYEEDKAKNERLVKEKAQKEAEKNASIPVATPVVASSPSNTAGDPQRESNFQNYWNSNPKVVDWRKEFKAQYGEEPSNSDGGYDYRGAFDAGLTPERNADDGNKYHWDSIGINGKDLKSANHPTRWKSEYMKQTGVNPDEKGITFDSAVQSNPTLEQYRPQTSEPISNQSTVAVPVEQPLSRAEQLMQQLYSTREAAPVHDQAKEDRLVRMGRINQIGRGIGVLGDVLTLGLGGKVNRSQPDRVQPMLYQQYQALMDKEKADQDSYKYRSYQNERANIGMELTQEQRKRQEKIASDNLKSANAYRDARDNEGDRRYYNGEISKSAAAKETARHNKAMENKKTGSQNEEDKPVKISTAKKTYELSRQEVDRINNESVGNKQIMDAHPDWFDKVEIMKDEAGTKENGWTPGKVGTGQFTIKPKSGLSKTALAQAYLEEIEKQENAPALKAKYGTSVASKSMIQTEVKPQYSTNGLY